MRPPPRRSADEWADAKRRLPDDAEERGPWRTDRVPYMRAIMRAFSDPGVEKIVAVMGSQMGKTEVLFNILGHRFDEGPRVPALYIGPTQKQVRSISTDRIRKLLRSTPSLWSLLETGQRDSTYEKFIADTRLGFAWAGSATELASHPAGLVLVDEVDRMGADVDGEGDPVTLAEARTITFSSRKIGVFTTPTVEGASRGWALLEEGTLEFWSWACLHCAERFVPRLELLRWPKDATPDQARAAARVVCPHCGAEHADADHAALNAGGAWLRHRKLPEDADEASKRGAVWGVYAVDPAPAPNRVRSFWVSGLASPFPAGASFGSRAAGYVRATRSNSQERIQAVVNTAFGELYRVEGEAPPWELVASLRRDYAPRTLPIGVQLVTLGADVQKRGVYYVARGWGYNLGSWLLEHGFIVGDTEFDQVWLLVSRTLAQRYGELAIARAFIDSGYRPGDKERRPEHAVYRFANRHHGLVYATKGHDVLDRPMKANDIDVTLGGRLLKGGLKLWHLNTDYLKSTIYSRLRWPEGEAGEWTLHRDADMDYCRQLVSEQILVTSSGRRVWMRKHENHYLDAEMNALAAAMSLQAEMLPPWEDAQAARQAAESAPPPAPSSSFIPRPQGSFIRR